MASNITAGLQSMLLIEHWYPGKYSVTCTLTVLPAMVARGTMLSRPAGSACRHQRRWVPGFSTFPAAGQSYGMGFPLQAALLVPPFVEPWRAGVPVSGPPIQPLPAPARRQSAQIRDPGA